MEPIKFISPSKFAYWEKCPIKAIYGKTYTDLTFFPKHPDADLGTILHYFLEKKKNYKLNLLMISKKYGSRKLFV